MISISTLKSLSNDKDIKVLSLALTKHHSFSTQNNRSSHSQMFLKIGVLKKSANFTGKHLKFAKFLRTFSFTEHLWLLLSETQE